MAQALRLYTWNVEVAAAFLGPLHLLEIGMRNSMHFQLSHFFEREDWWLHPEAPLSRTLQLQIERTHSSSIRTARRHGRTPHADDMVPGFGFSFWISMLSSGGKLQFETRYWQPILRHAFPHFHGSRKELFPQFDFLRTFRNRIAHHEPIFHRHLASDYESILRVSQYIDPALAVFIDSQSRVPEVLAKRARVVEQGYSSSF